MLMETIKQSVKFELVTISPEIAAAWLDQNTHNRPFKSSVADKYHRDLLSGEFMFAGQSICFDRNGVLLDGQHRLAACIKAGVPFQSIVVYGLDPKAQQHMDQGKGRTAADALALAGFHHTKAAAAVARLMLDEKLGRGDRVVPWTINEVVDTVNRHPQIHVSTRHVFAKKPPRTVPASQITYIHCVATEILGMGDTADAFVSVFVTGVPHYDGDPAHLFRERLIRSSDDTNALKRPDVWRGMKRTWNLFAAGKSVKIIKWQNDVQIDGLDLGLL